jgi:hypothetical protein
MIGKQLIHPALGRCVVSKVLSTPEVEVSFPDLGLSKKRYKLADLIDPSTMRAPEPNELPSKGRDVGREESVAGLDPKMLRARLAILALRLGQCPEGYIEELTVGATEVRDACSWALERSGRGRAAVVVFESPFGKGKSHALNIFSSAARKQFRAVGSIVLDGFGITLTEPMTLLTNLAPSIRFPEGQGLETLPERLCELVQKNEAHRLRRSGAVFLAECLERVPREIAEQPEAWEIVIDYLSCVLPASHAKLMLAPFRDNGCPPSLPPIVANRVDERAERCVKMLREWAQACTVAGAHRGLVVLLDEADVDYGNTGFREEMVKRRVWLYEAINNLAESDQQSMLSIGIAVTPGQDNYWGEEAVNEIADHLGEDSTRHVQLKDLSKHDFVRLGKKVASIYGEAYGSEVISRAEAESYGEELRDRLSSRIADSCLPRRFIREFIEHLDVISLQ